MGNPGARMARPIEGFDEPAPLPGPQPLMQEVPMELFPGSPRNLRPAGQRVDTLNFTDPQGRVTSTVRQPVPDDMATPRPPPEFPDPQEYTRPQQRDYASLTPGQRAGDQLRSGVETLKQGIDSMGLGGIYGQLQQIDRADQAAASGTPLASPRRMEAAAGGGMDALSPQQRAIMRERLEAEAGQKLTSIITSSNRQALLASNPAARAITEAGNEGRWRDAWRIFLTDPGGIIQQFAVESAPLSAPMIVGGLAAGLVGGPVLGALTAFGGSYGTEFGPGQVQAILEALRARGVDVTDERAVAGFLRTDPQIAIDAASEAGRAALGPAAFDAMGMGAAGGLRRGAGFLRNAGVVGRNTGLELAGEPAGAALGQILGGGSIDKPGDLIGEFLGAGPQVVGSTAYGTLMEMRQPSPLAGVTAQQPQDQTTTAPNPGMPADPQAPPPAAGVPPSQVQPTQDVPPAAPGAGAAVPPAGPAPPPVHVNPGAPDLEADLQDPRPAEQIEAEKEAAAQAALQQAQAALPRGWTVERQDGDFLLLDPHGNEAGALNRAPDAEAVEGWRRLAEQANATGVYNDAIRDGDGTKAAPVQAVRPGDVDHAAGQANPAPTPAQAEAGNYAKGHVRLHGLDIAIETRKGETRTGVGADGRPWSVQMPAHYGEVKGTVGSDGDAVDVYLGHDAENPNGTVYVIDQVDADTGKFDEHKAIIGAGSLAEAQRLYHAAFNDGRGPDRMGAVLPLTLPEFKAWLASGKTKQPLNPAQISKGIRDRRAAAAQQQKAEADAKAAQAAEEKARKDAEGQKVKAEADKRADAAKQYQRVRSLIHKLREAGMTDYAKSLAEMVQNNRKQGVPPGAAGVDELEASVTRTIAQHIEKQEAERVRKLAEQKRRQDLEAEQKKAKEEAAAPEGEKGEKKGEKTAAPKPEPVAPAVDPEPSPAPAPAGPKLLVSDDRMAELKAKLKAKMQGQLNAGLDPEMIALGAELAVGYLERGTRRFAAWSAQVVSDLGEEVRPFLRAWYESARYYPGFDNAGMTPAAQIDSGEPEGDDNADGQGGSDASGGGTAPAAGPAVDPEPGNAQPDPEVVGDGAPGDVGAAPDAEPVGDDGLPGATADVGGTGPAGGSGNADNGRPRGGRAQPSSAGAGSGNGGNGAADGGTGGSGAGSAGGVATPSPAGPSAGDFHIDDPAAYLGGGPVARFNRNRAAIETLNAVRDSDRPATREEQEKLAGYTGWGSFGQDLFKGSWQNPNPRPGWEERDRWLRAHLGRPAWESAQASILNAHYTDPPVVLAMWDMVRRAGFEGGRVLEPSMGTGNFFSLMPQDLKARSDLTGIELDTTTAEISKLLFPDSNVRQMPYQDSRTPDGFYDVVIGNWPFAGQTVADRRHGKMKPTLHDFFFLKALDQARAGGLVIGITSHGTMDKEGTRVRAHLARNAELVAAIRLPTGAFEGYAGTAVVTDIVVLKKRATPLLETPDEAWVKASMVPTPAGPEVRLNEYFRQNPERVLGTVNFGSGTTQGSAGLIVDRPDNLMEKLTAAVEAIPEGAYERERANDHITYITNHTADREGALVFQGDEAFVVRGEQLAPAHQVAKFLVKSAKENASRLQQLRDLVAMRRAYAELITKERAGQDAEAERTTLRQQFEAFTKANGPLNKSFGLAYLSKIDDPFYPALAALMTKDGKPAAILSRSTMRAKPKLENPSIADAFVLARQQSIRPTLAEIAALTGKPADEVKAGLIKSGAVFETVDGDVEPSDLYLSGNVRVKLRQAQAAVAEGQKHLQRNVDALKEVQPKDVPYYDIEVQLGATWVPEDVYEDYVAHMLNRPNTEGINIRFTLGRWKARLTGLNNLSAARSGFGMDDRRVPFSRLLQAAMSNQTFKVMAKDDKGTEYVDPKPTKQAADRIANIRASFGEWLWKDAERRVALEQSYNETRNAHATPKYDGSFMAFEGMALSLGRGEFQLRQHQVNAIWRAVVNRKSINAHEVGTGKTFTMGGIAVESRRYGIAKKPLILAHNANSKAVSSEIQAMYPAAKVLYIDNLAPSEVEVQLRRIANDDWDAIVVPHSQIDRFALSKETLMEIAKEEIEALEQAAIEAAKEDGSSVDVDDMDAIRAGDKKASGRLRSPTAKDLVRARNSVLNKIDALAIRASRDKAVQFENLGIDMILVDEAHEFKKPPIVTGMKMKGLQTQTSDMSIALNFLTSYVRRQNNGNGIHTFTGTPITNTLVEIFHQMRYVMLEEMKAAGVDTWDAWFGSFSREVQDVELSAAGEYEPITRLAAFINVPELRRLVGQYLDVVFGDDMPEMQPRRTESGKTMASPDLTEAERVELENGRTENAGDRPYKKVVNVTSEMTDEQVALFEQFQQDSRTFRNAKGKERRRLMAIGDPSSPVIVEGGANLASFDERMYDRDRLRDNPLHGQEGTAPLDPRSKVAQVVKNVTEIYNSDPRANQVIFADQGYNSTSERAIPETDPKQTKRVKTFSAIKDLVERLVASGIPREQIALVTGGASAEKKFEISEAMNEGRLRVVIGLSSTLGVGVNMQRNLRAMHHMDAPYMPGDLEQRNGRGWRQGNQWNTVLEYRYITDRLDGRRWQILAVKQRFILSFMKDNNAASRIIEGEAAADAPSDFLESFAEAAGDPRALTREQMKRKLEGLNQAERMHGQAVADSKKMLADQLTEKKRIADWLTDAEKEGGPVGAVAEFVERTKGDAFEAVIGGKKATTRAEATDAVKALTADMRQGDSQRPAGQIADAKITMAWPRLGSTPEIAIKLGGWDFFGTSIASLESQIRNFLKVPATRRQQASEIEANIERLREVVAAPFSRAKQLKAAKQTLEDLEADLTANPVAPPGWLRIGTPRESTVFWQGKPFTVTGHRWNKDGWFVLAEDDRGGVVIPYTEATDQQGIPAYEERPFTSPVVVDPKAAGAQGGTTVNSGLPFSPENFRRFMLEPAQAGIRAATEAFQRVLDRVVEAVMNRQRPVPGNIVVADKARADTLTPFLSRLRLPNRMFRRWPALASLVDQGIKAEEHMSIWTKRLAAKLDNLLGSLKRGRGDREKVMAALLDADANEVDIEKGDVADAHWAAHGLNAAEASAAAGLNRLLVEVARLVDQHRRAMLPKVVEAKATVWRQMKALMDSASVAGPQYQQAYRRRSYLNRRIREGKGDLAAHAAEIRQINDDLRAMRASDPSIQDRLDDLREQYDALEARLQATSVRTRKGYFPHKFFGSWRLYEITKEKDPDTGEPVRREITSDQGFYDTQGEAIAAAEAFLKENPGASLRVEPKVTVFPGNSGGAVLSDAAFGKLTRQLQKQAGLEGEALAEALKGVAKRQSRRRVFSPSLQRKGAEGFAEDLERVMRTHIAQAVRYVELDKLKWAYVSTMERLGLSAADPRKVERSGQQEVQRTMAAWFRDVNGTKQPGESQLDAAIQRAGIPRATLVAFGGMSMFAGLVGAPIISLPVGAYFALRTANALKKGGDFPTRTIVGDIASDFAILKLGVLNIASAVVNLTQTVVNTYPVLGEKWTAIGMKRASAALWSQARNAATPGRMSTDAILLQRADIASRFNLQSENPVLAHNKDLVDRVRGWFMLPFESVERFNRATAFLGAYARAEDQGLSPARATQAAQDVLRRTQFHQGNATRPEILRDQLLRLPAQFKNFMAQQIGFVVGLEGKEIGRFLVGVLLVAGLLGFPGLQLLDWLVLAFTGVSAIGELRNAILTSGAAGELAGTFIDALGRGLPALLGTDISSRVGVGAGFLPDSGSDFSGPLTGTIRSLSQVAQGHGGLADYLTALGPFGNPLKAMEAAANGASATSSRFWTGGVIGDGESRMTNPRKRSETEYRPTNGELVRYGLGFRPLSQSLQADQRAVQARETKERTDKQNRALAAYVQARWDGAPQERLVELANAARRAGVTQRRIVDTVRDSERTRAERDLRRAPKELRPGVRERQQAIEARE
jgi:N12 class adenine-specific DNA methylase